MVGTDWKLITVGWPESCVGAVVLDRRLDVVALTGSLIRRSNHEASRLVGSSVFRLVHPRDRDRVQFVWVTLDQSPDPEGQVLVRVQVGTGYETFGVQMTRAPHDEGLVIMHLYQVSAELRASELSRDLVRAIRVLSGKFSLAGVADALQHMTDRQFVGVAICTTIFADDGSAMTFPAGCFTAEHMVANAMSDRRVLQSRAVGSKQEDPSTPQRLVFPLVDDADDRLGYLEVIRPWKTAPTSHEWLVYGSVAEVMHAAATRFRLDAALRWAADHDALTCLLNRRGFAEATRDASGGVVFVADLDNFSSINNDYGHAAGDVAIAAAAQSLTRVSPPEAVLARLGGDEFIGWLPGAAITDGVELAEDLRDSLATRVSAEDDRFDVRASIGLVEVGAEETIERALRRADAAMYEAKARGGNQSISRSLITTLEKRWGILAGNI